MSPIVHARKKHMKQPIKSQKTIQAPIMGFNFQEIRGQNVDIIHQHHVGCRLKNKITDENHFC